MAFVHMKCPNCGMNMELADNQFACPYCNTMIFNIVDAKIDGDVTVMSPEEFGETIEKNKKQFLVKIDDQLKVFDVDTMVVNKKIRDASLQLQRREFKGVEKTLDGVPNNILSVERLRLLSAFEVRNEYELSFYDGYIDSSWHYEKILKLADEQTRETYKKLAKYCREQHDTKERIKKEIEEVNKLLEVKLYQEAIAYTKEMCKRYPQTALSWAYACEVKCAISENYSGKVEFSMMQKCPDYAQTELPSVLKKKIESFKNLSRHYVSATNATTRAMGILAGLLWGMLAILAGGILPILYGNGNVNPSLIGLISFSSFILFIAVVVITIMAVGAKKDERETVAAYKRESNLLPQSIREKYKLEMNSSRRKLFVDLILLWGIGFVIFIFFVVRRIVGN